MTSISCPRTGCTYETGKVEAVVAAALLTAHSTEHGPSVSSSSSAVQSKPNVLGFGC